MKRRLAAAIAMTIPCLGHPLATSATEITWASQDDAATLDPHAFNHGMTMTVLAHFYEGLVRRDREQRIEPALAESWEQPAPTVWRFSLRPGATFHDGTALTAGDVIFSIKRALSDGTDMKIFTASIADVRAVDDLTVEIETEFPNAAMIQSLPEVRIMSQAWAVAHDAVSPSNVRQGKENYASTHANGTGPYRLVSREPEVKTVLEANSDWWDNERPDVTGATLVRIASGPTLVAALLTGEVDFAYPVPLQDVARVDGTEGLKVLTGPEIRTMFLSMEQVSDTMKYGSVTDANPFMDQRVRQAVYQALDVDAIATKVMRGSATPTGNLMAPGVNSVAPELQSRFYPRETTAATLAKLKLLFPKGTVTAGNASGVNDGAAALVLASEVAARAHGLTPIARVLGGATAGVPPRIMGIGPAPASQKLIERLGLTLDDFDVIELNEAFAAQGVATLRQLGLRDDDPRVNPNGGAIAIAHPIGMSGARITATAALELVRTKGWRSLSTMCIGVGQGIAIALERV